MRYREPDFDPTGGWKDGEEVYLVREWGNDIQPGTLVKVCVPNYYNPHVSEYDLGFFELDGEFYEMPLCIEQATYHGFPFPYVVKTKEECEAYLAKKEVEDEQEDFLETLTASIEIHSKAIISKHDIIYALIEKLEGVQMSDGKVVCKLDIGNDKKVDLIIHDWE